MAVWQWIGLNSSQCTVCASSGCGYGAVQALYSKYIMLLFLLDAKAQRGSSAQSTSEGTGTQTEKQNEASG